MDVSLTESAVGSVKEQTGRRSGMPAPSTVQRVVTVLAAISLFIGMRDLWNATIIRFPPLAALLMVSYGLIMICAVVALAVRTTRWLLTAEVVLLCIGVLRAIAYFVSNAHSRPPYVSDEGTLVQEAAHGLLRGAHVYGTSFPLPPTGVDITKLMNGGIDYTFGYPPLSVAFSSAAIRILPGVPAAGVIAMLGLVVAGVLMFLVLPPAWRSTATLICFGLGYDLLMPSARQGYPTLVMLPFLVVVVAGWTRTGRGGRLGRGGMLRAACLGLAAATQQLAWFLAPFLIIGIFLARRREMTPRAAAKLTLRYAGVSGGVFLLVNLPFIAQGPSAWLNGVFTPLVQHAVPHGQGLVDISYYFRDGSGDLSLYSTAALLLLVTLLIALACFPRRLGPAAVILPWLSFYLSTRSQDGYYVLLVPIWVISALTTDAADFSGAGVAAWLRRWGRDGTGPVWERVGGMRRWAVLVPLAATVGCLGFAVFTPPPLRMSVTHVRAGSLPDTVTGMTVTVVNRSGSSVRPHFALTTTGPGLTNFWKVDSGPTTLRPHQSADYKLTTGRGPYHRGPHGHVTLSAVTDQPMAISTTDVPMAS